jgi:hypothetical protein
MVNVLSVIMLNVVNAERRILIVMLNASMFSVVMLSVAAPK